MIDTSLFTSSETVHVKFNEDNPVDMRACQLIVERYTGQECPLMTFSRDGVTTLVVPRTIRKVFDAKPVTSEAPAVLRIPDGAGGINGNR